MTEGQEDESGDEDDVDEEEDTLTATAHVNNHSVSEATNATVPATTPLLLNDDVRGTVCCAVTVKPLGLGIGKIVTISDCHSNNILKCQLEIANTFQIVSVGNCHSDRCHYNRRSLCLQNVGDIRSAKKEIIVNRVLRGGGSGVGFP